MKPAPFEYERAADVASALSTLAKFGKQAKVLAGGQSLIPMLNLRIASTERLIDVSRLEELRYIRVAGNELRIGALTTHNAVLNSPEVAAQCPIMVEAYHHVSHHSVRNRGTIGGSLCHADPAAELPMMAVLLDARIGIRSPRGQRIAEARGFFTGSLTTDLAEDEIVTDVEFPVLPPGTGWAFEELARRAGDFALAAVGVTISERDGKSDQVRIGMMGVGDTPLRAPEAEGLLTGIAINAAAIEEAAAAMQRAVEPNSDLHA
jgi:CO/xanthine dehydrogenase FAD-binding subunit